MTTLPHLMTCSRTRQRLDPRLLSRWGCAWISLFFSLPRVVANPSGLAIQTGSATTQASGKTLNITTSDRAVLTWDNFTIRPGETTRFQQPSVASIVWNQIRSGNPTEILGTLSANGRIVLANDKGFYFGKDALVTAAGFAAVTTASPPPGFSFGGDWTMNIEPPSARIVNEGVILAKDGGAIYLLANRIENRGEIRADRGEVRLESGREIHVSERSDGRGLTMTARLDSGLIDNQGRLVADAGEISLRAQVVNQSGTISANSVRNVNGVIEIVASAEVNLGERSVLLAKGGDSPASPGGRVLLKSAGTISDSDRSTISVNGGKNGGDAGSVEYSAPEVLALRSTITAGAQIGYRKGELIIDPDTIVIAEQGNATGSGTVTANGGVGQLSLNPASFSEFSRISLQATRDIVINSPWLLGDLNEQTPGQLSLKAGGDIRIASSASLQAGLGWSLNLVSGVDLTTGSVRSGIGSVLLAGAATISSKDGNIRILAGRDVTVATGAIRTTVGGGVAVSAGGSINTGNRTDGYLALPQNLWVIFDLV